MIQFRLQNSVISPLNLGKTVRMGVFGGGKGEASIVAVYHFLP